jgi:rhomboid protease GluP
VESPRERAGPCPRCGALNSAGFDRCIRCAAPLASLTAGADALKGSLDSRQLWGTKILIGLTVIVFAGQLFAMKGHLDKALFSGGSRAALLRFGAMPISIEDVAAEPFRLLSAAFVHIGALHIVMNMMGLANIGRVAEPGIGSARFVNAYLVSGVLGFAVNLATLAIFPDRGPIPVLTAGASGAVFGAMGLILGWLIYHRDKRWRGYVVQAVFFAVVLNFLGMSINNGAHIGGLVCGAVLGFYYAARPRPKSLLYANIGAIVGLVLAVASLLLAQRAAQRGEDDLRELDARLNPAGFFEPARVMPPPPATLRIRSSTLCATRIDSCHEVAV